MSPEGTIATAGQQTDSGAGCGDDIQLAVSMKVSRGDGSWGRSGRVIDVRLEGSVAVVEEHRNRIRAGIGDRNIRFAVTIEISDRHVPWLRDDGVLDRRLEAPITISNENHYSWRNGITGSDGYIRLAVTIKISGCERSNAHSVLDVTAVWIQIHVTNPRKCPVAVPQVRR